MMKQLFNMIQKPGRFRKAYLTRSLNTVLMVLGTLLQLDAQNPNTEPLDWLSFRRQVISSHPAAVQANLRLDQARAYLLKARGGFDPKAYAEVYGKNFNGKEYFNYGEAGIKIPTWMGLEFKGAYNQASGIYLDPESTLPADGQVSAGITWRLGQGLLFDERRADLAQARIGLRAAEAERDLILNNLLLDAMKAYWTWVIAENQLRVYEEALRQAQLRIDAIRESVVQGDKPAIDTTETLLQVQIRQLDVNFARLERQNAALELANYWWTDANTTIAPALLPPAPRLDPLLPPGLLPDAVRTDLRLQALANHPELRGYEAKLQNLSVERRLKNEWRKPSLDLNYYLLGNGWTFFPTPYPGEGIGVVTNNTKYGLSFSYPILNRKARGDYQLAQIKVRDTELALSQKKRAIEMKFNQYLNELDNYAGQIVLFAGMTSNYRSLLDAELAKFELGESSVFLVNTREQRWLDAQIKYQELVGEYQKANVALLWSAGTLAN
ncbi:MAG: TolC family protein [Saprospiraceae bacterium]|nr:TolC family protein [Saprospiraceae bacterium]